jgi:hypothetical protein
MSNTNFKFKGGIRIGLWSNSWPFGVLEFNQDNLILRDEMIKKEYKFSKEEISKIEIKKFFPIIGFGIKIVHVKEIYDKNTYFWYLGFHFQNFISSLKEMSWIK